jgi:peroxiredoxin
MKLGQLAQLAFVLLAGMAVYAFVTMAKDAEGRRACVPLCAMRPSYAGTNRTAPDFELTTLVPTPDGKQKIRLSQYRGQTVVLNFWTTTCKPCLEEMPSLADLAKVLKRRKDVVLLTVSTDATSEPVTSALATLLREKIPFPVMLDPESDIVGAKYGTHLFPETWIIDPQGVIRARFDGARDWSNAMVLDLIDSFERPAACSVEFQAGKPSGPGAAVCEESGSTG